MPASVVVLGGGVIGVEFASVWRSFGAEVTIVEALPHLLPTEEESSSKLLERAFRRRGIGFKLGIRFESVKDTGTASPSRSRAARPSTPSCCSSRSAAARSPPASATTRSASPWTAASCSSTSYCQTNVPASTPSATCGPACSWPTSASPRASWSPSGSPGLPVIPVDYDGVPRVTYSDPEVASVGITSATAAARGIEVTEFTYDLAGNGKSQILQTAARRRSSPRPAAARCSACTWSAPGSAT